jgi:hypothetical protein
METATLFAGRGGSRCRTRGLRYRYFRLEPPREFTAGSIERSIFVETVMFVPDDHLDAEDRVLLAEYCRTAALARRATEELAASAVVGPMPSPWLAVHGSACSMALLSTRLRLGPRSRSHNVRKGKPGSPPSYYDLNPISAPPKDRSPSW